MFTWWDEESDLDFILKRLEESEVLAQGFKPNIIYAVLDTRSKSQWLDVLNNIPPRPEG